jgi:hypothetical protein
VSLVEVSVSIVHHPLRVGDLMVMLDGLDGLNVTVCTDEGQGPVENTRGAWTSFDPRATWHLVMEDDLRLCADFAGRLNAALEHVPFLGGAVSLFGVSKRYAEAYGDGYSYYSDNGVNWAQALLLPVPLIPEFIAWEMAFVAREHRWFCQRLTAWCQANDLPVQYTLPMLVDHVGAGRSLVGNPKKIGSVERRAACFVEHYPVEWIDGRRVIWKENHAKCTPESLK